MMSLQKWWDCTNRKENDQMILKLPTNNIKVRRQAASCQKVIKERSLSVGEWTHSQLETWRVGTLSIAGELAWRVDTLSIGEFAVCAEFVSDVNNAWTINNGEAGAWEFHVMYRWWYNHRFKNIPFMEKKNIWTIIEVLKKAMF